MLPDCAATASSSLLLGGERIGIEGKRRACSGGERDRMVTVASGVCRGGGKKREKITWEAGVFLQCRHSREFHPQACGP